MRLWTQGPSSYRNLGPLGDVLVGGTLTSVQLSDYQLIPCRVCKTDTWHSLIRHVPPNLPVMRCQECASTRNFRLEDTWKNIGR